eukprot:GFUD01007346.1.p1 GENE.GFUD01007346.1~~GFUD01007346.1.p1  ORF type:complete len:314 (-),score=94.65 GFUD01007346.1:29-970(-)
MANGEKFCLRWNDFENNISIAFRELRDDKDFFDVTFVCDDNQVQAHKVILSACSPFFRSVLKKNPHQHPLLFLRGVKYEEILSILNFMYHGQVSVAQEELNSFLAVAEDLQVKGLTATGEKQQPTSQSLPAAKLSLPAQSPACSVMPVHARPAKQARLRTSYEHAMPGGGAPYAEESDSIPPVIKSETPVVDVDCDPEPSSGQQLARHSRHFPVEQSGYEYQEDYQGQDMGYEEQEQGVQVGNTSQDFYSQHIRKASDGGYICNLCDKQVRDFYGMKRHLEGKHEITPGYNCPVCQVFCKTKDIMMRHRKTYH